MTTATRPIYVPIPGERGERIDARLVRDIDWIRRTFPVDVTAAYATSGHAAAGEHPLGLAVDVTPDPRRGGTWDDVDRLVEYARSRPDVFRWIGYDGVPNHGRGDHAHLSWWGNPRFGKPVNTIFGPGGEPKKDGKGFDPLGIIGKAATTVLGPAGDVVDIAGDVADDIGLPGPDDVAGKVIKGVWGLVGDEATRAALWVALIVAAIGLAVVGLCRATCAGGRGGESSGGGMSKRDLALMLATRGAAGGARAASAARSSRAAKGVKAA